MAVQLIRWFLKSVGVIVGCLVVSVSAALLILDDDDYRRISVYVVERLTGRTVEISGPFSLDVSMQPTLTVSDLRVGNPAWATHPYLAQFGHLEIQLSLRPLLSGTLSVPRLVVSDTQVYLETNANGDHSWTSGTHKNAHSTNGVSVPALGNVKLQNVTAQYINAGTKQETSFQVTSLSVDEIETLNHLKAHGSWGDRQFDVSGKFGILSEALKPTKPFPLELTMSLPDMNITVDGTIVEPTEGNGLNLSVTAVSQDVSKFMTELGVNSGFAGEFHGSAAVAGNISAPRLTKINITLADNKSQAAAATEITITGGIANLNTREGALATGVDLEARFAGPSTSISGLLNAQLPDLGPVDASFALSGNSDTLKISNVEMTAGDRAGLEIGATGGVTSVHLRPKLSMSGLDLKIQANAPTVTAATKPIGFTTRELGPVAFTAQLSGGLSQLDLNQIDLRIGTGDHPMQVIGEIKKVVFREGIVASIALKAELTPWLEGLTGRTVPDLGTIDVSGNLTKNVSELQLSQVNIVADDTDVLSLKATSATTKNSDLGWGALDIDILAKDLGVFGTLLDLPVPALGPASFHGRLSGKLEAPHLVGSAQLGQSVFTEDLVLTVAGARPRLSGKISTPVLYLADIGLRPDGPWQTGESDKDQSAPVSLPFDALRTIDLSLLVDVDQIEGVDMSIDRGILDLALDDGVLQVNPLRFDTVGGSFNINANVNARMSPATIVLDAVGENIVLKEVFSQIHKNIPIDGDLDMQLNLTSRGDTFTDIIASLDGSADVGISRGHIYNRHFDLLGASLIHWLMLGKEARAVPDIRCFVGQFAVDAGDARIKALLLETSATISRASGNFNLARETLDIFVQPHSLTSRLLISTPYRVEGPWRAPHVDYSRLRLAARAVEELALAPIFTLDELAPRLRSHGRAPTNACLEWAPTPSELNRTTTSSFDPVASSFPIDPITATRYVALTDTHVRSGPGTNFGSVRTLAAGEMIEVTGKLGDMNWYRVDLSHNRQGYIWGKLIHPDD
ncbi:AsmA family protein [Pseudoruegeria sp. SK021]|uniref:AsmA family protein n=1 Tax=Pseudoruegeria sp. SK021 TaxID=1933035 RepID=UPI000A23A459|nr:AsmA family protein [Pseudoruegeria sp. SK021]OSP53659.1 hypothetical protein BV911_16785 [Pseudoruegeria sp. SK021]